MSLLHNKKLAPFEARVSVSEAAFEEVILSVLPLLFFNLFFDFLGLLRPEANLLDSFPDVCFLDVLAGVEESLPDLAHRLIRPIEKFKSFVLRQIGLFQQIHQ
jgi:hypothetical protein